MRAVRDEYGTIWAFDSAEEARAWVTGLLAACRRVNLVCRVHDAEHVPERGGMELCGLCEAEHRTAGLHLTVLER